MELNTKENGIQIKTREMGKANKFGLMVLFTRVIGNMTRQMVEVV